MALFFLAVQLTGRFRHGYGQYFMGTGFFYMFVSGLYRTTRPPFVVGGLAMIGGYVATLLKRKPRYDDVAFRRFLRRFHRNCLLRGKSAAVKQLDEQQASVWHPNAPR